MVVMGGCVTGSVASAGTISVNTDPPTGVFASGAVDGPNYTRVFADGARTSDYNEGRGNEIIADSGSYAGGAMTALVIRKDAAQDFTGDPRPDHPSSLQWRDLEPSRSCPHPVLPR